MTNTIRTGVAAMAVAVALAAGTLPAQAADLAQPAPAPAPVADYAAPSVLTWTGFYLGAHAGYGWGDADTNASDPDLDGFLGGAQAGYNYQFDNNIVIGVEGDWSWSGVDGSSGGVSSDVDWVSSLRGRLGYAFDRYLVYGTGGVAFANVETSRGGFSDDNNHTGWAAGAGLEAVLPDTATGRWHYLNTALA